MTDTGEPRELAPGLFLVRIPGDRAHKLNVYLWSSPADDGVTVVDTGWPDSAPFVAAALRGLGRDPGDVRRVVLTHFHDDHTGSAAEVAGWGAATVVAGRDDAAFVRGTAAWPWPPLTDAERAMNPPMPGSTNPPPCRVDHEAADGDVLDFAGGTVVYAVGGHTPGSIALHLRGPDLLLTGDLVAEWGGAAIVGPFNTDRAQSHRAIARLATVGAGAAAFGHGEPLLTDAARHLAACADPLG